MPSFQCGYCANLSISHLIELAEQEFADILCSFPSHGFYQHHASLADLEMSAHQGCALCRLVLEYLKGAEEPSNLLSRELIRWTGSMIGAGKNSAYSIARGLPRNHVRMCIMASHVYSSDPIDKVRVFDRVIVQIGDVEDPDATPGGIDSLAPLAFMLTTPRGMSPFIPCHRRTDANEGADKPIYLKNYRIGRYELDPDLDSSLNMSIARGWLRGCREEHPGCSATHSSVLPTRVVDVGPVGGYQAPKLVFGEGLKADYVALSHCWGGPITPVLDKNTFDAFKSAIPIDALPANFRDAIAITRGLGIRFIWIDSLCIFQDSRRDWEIEAKNMGNVYRNSTVTLSASASPGSKHGILRGSLAPPSSLTMPGHTHMRVFPRDSDVEATYRDLEIRIQIEDVEEENLWSLENHGPLASRGWTLQESVLPRRQLFYGARQLYWRCSRGFECAEGLPPGNNRTPNDLYVNAARVLHCEAPEPGIGGSLSGSGVLDSNDAGLGGDNECVLESQNEEVNTVVEDYYQLVQDYSCRRLTVASDKLPAFSGLAQGLCGAFDGSSLGSAAYLAGLWASDLHRGLTWHSEMRTCAHVPIYRAPSWSWASTDERVLFMLNPRQPTEFDLRVLDYNISPHDPENPFGEIVDAELIVTGRTKLLERSKQVIETRGPDHSIGMCWFDDVETPGDDPKLAFSELFRAVDGSGNEEQDYIISIRKEYGEEEAWEVDLNLISKQDYLVLLIHLYGGQGYHEGTVNARCLVVRPFRVGDDIRYERVGQAGLDVKLDWIQSWNIMTLKLV